MSLLNIYGLGFRFPATDDLFRNVSFEVNPQDKIGLVGRNGAGKTSLMRILSGKLEPTEGKIVRRSGLQVELVEQSAPAPEGTSLLDFVLSAQAEIEAKARQVLGGLGFSSQETKLPLSRLSSGQRARAALARGLLSGAHVLLLDEPTNHLDVEAREWLEEFVSGATAACIVVSHDRAFLNGFARRILEIDRLRVRQFAGNYDAYRSRRSLLDRQEWESYEAQQKRIAAAGRASENRAQLARNVAKAPAGVRSSRDFYARKASKVARTARLIRERVSHEPEVAKPWEEAPIPELDFPMVPRSGDIALSVDRLAKSYGSKHLFSDLTFHLARGERVALAGPNGSGKTTLLRILLGLELADAGRYQFGANVRAGYYAQEGENLDPAQTPLEICGGHVLARTLLACLKLPRDRVVQPVACLSAGERAKVALTRLLVSGANLLLLDEPTNHLEIEAQEAVEQTLAQYPGTVLLVSHDRRFLAAIVSRTIRL